MPSYTIKCPYCHTSRTVTQNSHVNCPGCRAVLHVGNDGKIKSSKPGKKQMAEIKKIEYMCSYCGKKEIKTNLQGRPMPGKCSRRIRTTVKNKDT